MKKVNIKVHPEAKESLQRYFSDLRAGHTDAAEFWRGQASAFFTANPRPPRQWFERMWKIIAPSYPIHKNESREHYIKAINQIVAGIWWKLPQSTRNRLIRKYG